MQTLFTLTRFMHGLFIGKLIDSSPQLRGITFYGEGRRPSYLVHNRRPDITVFSAGQAAVPYRLVRRRIEKIGRGGI